MSEEFNEFPDAPTSYDELPQKKSNKTLWIILGIAAALLLCCCVFFVIVFWVDPFDLRLMFNHITPLLALI